MNDERNRQLVQTILTGLIQFYQTHQAAILTESDLKCEVFSRLRSIADLGTPFPTADAHITGHSIHSEVKFFDRDDKLSIAPDICLFRPSAISIERGLGGRLRLPRKGFHATGNPIMIELKFLRTRHLSERALSEIRGDYEKWINPNTAERNFHLFQFILSKYASHIPAVRAVQAGLPTDPRHSFVLGARVVPVPE